MDRRAFIAMVGARILAGPRIAGAQGLDVPLIGYLSVRSPEESSHLLAAFRPGLGLFAAGRNEDGQSRPRCG